ncbi:MAG: helix-turn-helix domain-containing protein [Nitrospira sp.]|nr:helix-turn-helix domain-containing protein [Nitrospira sp.]
MPRKSPYTILLTQEEKKKLEEIARRYTSPYYNIIRAKITLYAAQGMENKDIGLKLNLPRQIISKWRKRFYERRLNGLEDEERKGRPPIFSPSRSSRNKSTCL